MDDRTRFMNLLRKEFGNLLGNVRVKVVTVGPVDWVNRIVTVNFAQPDPSQEAPDPQNVPWIWSYTPVEGEQAYLVLIEGAPVLIGSVSGTAPQANLWIAPTLGAAFANYTTAISGFTPPNCSYTVMGRKLIFQGNLTNAGATAAAVPFFTLPAGVRPSVVRTGYAVDITAAGVVTPVRCDALPTGEVRQVFALAAGRIVSFEQYEINLW